MDIINKYKSFDNLYKNNVENINRENKNKYFNYQFNNHINNKSNTNNKSNINNMIKIRSLDDMFDILYLKNKYLNNNIINKLYSNILTSLNYKQEFTGNITIDIYRLLNKYNNLNNILHDTQWIKSTHISTNNYFDADENQTLIYNSTDKTSLNYKEFKDFVYNINNELNELNDLNTSYENINLKVDLYQDDKYDMIWIIISINKMAI